MAAMNSRCGRRVAEPPDERLQALKRAGGYRHGKGVRCGNKAAVPGKKKEGRRYAGAAAGIGGNLRREAERWARERGPQGIRLVTQRRADRYRKHFDDPEIGRTVVEGVMTKVLAKPF